MEKVHEFCKAIISKLQNWIFWKIVIIASLLFIVSTDITILVFAKQDSDDNNLSFGYYIFFMITQIWWNYSSWIMFLIFYYPRKYDIPDSLEDFIEEKCESLVKRFKSLLLKILMFGKYSCILFDKSLFLDSCIYQHLDNSNLETVVRFWIYLLYVSTFGLIITSWLAYLFLVPILMLKTIRHGVQYKYEDERIYGSRNAIYFQSGLIVWWIINYSIINTLGPNFSLGMIVVQILYALLMIWFFATITLKTIDFSKYSMIFNPLVLIFESMFAAIFGVIYSSILLWFCVKDIWSLSNSHSTEAPDRDLQVYQNVNQDIHQITWELWSDLVFWGDRDSAILPWGHIFHFDCIKIWIEIKRNKTCPKDHKRIVRSQIRKLML